MRQRLNQSPLTPSLSPGDATYRDYIDHAEVCREQARDAARLHRFQAACGLLATAVALYQSAIKYHAKAANQEREPECEATIQLRDVQLERDVYVELARSQSRPLLAPPPRRDADGTAK